MRNLKIKPKLTMEPPVKVPQVGDGSEGSGPITLNPQEEDMFACCLLEEGCTGGSVSVGWVGSKGVPSYREGRYTGGGWGRLEEPWTGNWTLRRMYTFTRGSHFSQSQMPGNAGFSSEIGGECTMFFIGILGILENNYYDYILLSYWRSESWPI